MNNLELHLVTKHEWTVGGRGPGKTNTVPKEGVHKRQTMVRMQQSVAFCVTIHTFHWEKKMGKLNQ